MSKSTTQVPAAVVTGVSSGIGLAIAETLLARGWRVFGSVRREADAEPLVVRHGAAFVPLVFDVTDAQALPGAVEQVRQALGPAGRLKALVNNAGISMMGPVMHQPLEDIRQVFEVNVFAVLTVTRAFVPLLGEGGRVVNMGSVSGAMTPPFMAAYSASKHALEAMGQAMRRELLLQGGIHVATIEPSFIRTRISEKAQAQAAATPYAGTGYAEAWRVFNESLRKDEARGKPPEVVTRAVLHAIESPKPRTRYPLTPEWHVGRLLPDRMFDRLIFKATGLDKLIHRA